MSLLETKQTKRIFAQYEKATKEPDEYIKYAINEDNPSEWYIMIHNIAGDNDEYVEGEFLFRMTLNDNFPYDPPSFIALTPNGLYTIGVVCCISIGEFHKKDYRTVLGVSGFAKELANGLMNWRHIGSGLNLMKTTEMEKRKYAKQSKEYNEKNNKKILNMINEQYKKYSKKWDLSKISDDLKKKLNIQ